MIAVVEPGLVNLDLSAAVSKFGLYYAPDPSSQKACTIGGNVAENAGGPHCLSYGVTTNHVLGLEVVLHNGDLMWVGSKVRDVPGYDLTGSIVGSEGTFVVVTKVIVRLMPKPESVKTLLAVYDNPIDATNTVSSVIGAGIVPAAMEMMDNLVIQAVEKVIKAGFPKDAGAVLLIEVEGLDESTRAEVSAIEEICKANKASLVRSADDPAERERLWAGRKSAFGALGSIAPNYYIVDGVVPRTRLPEIMEKVEEICARYDVVAGNVFHAGDGNLHPIILFDERVEGMKERVLEAGAEMLRACIDVGWGAHRRARHRRREADVHALGLHSGGHGRHETAACGILPDCLHQPRQNIPRRGGAAPEIRAAQARAPGLRHVRLEAMT